MCPDSAQCIKANLNSVVDVLIAFFFYLFWTKFCKDDFCHLQGSYTILTSLEKKELWAKIMFCLGKCLRFQIFFFIHFFLWNKWEFLEVTRFSLYWKKYVKASWRQTHCTLFPFVKKTPSLFGALILYISS